MKYQFWLKYWSIHEKMIMILNLLENQYTLHKCILGRWPGGTYNSYTRSIHYCVIFAGSRIWKKISNGSHKVLSVSCWLFNFIIGPGHSLICNKRFFSKCPTFFFSFLTGSGQIYVFSSRVIYEFFFSGIFSGSGLTGSLTQGVCDCVCSAPVNILAKTPNFFPTRFSYFSYFILVILGEKIEIDYFFLINIFQINADESTVKYFGQNFLFLSHFIFIFFLFYPCYNWGNNNSAIG